MSAAGLIGRVGGLAVALGVGAAAFNGAVAWADSSGSGDSSTHAGSARSTSGDAGSTADPAKHAAAKVASGRSRPATTVRAQSTTTDTLTSVAATSAASADPSAPDAPTVPTGSPLELAALAYSRRDTGVAAAATSLVPEASVQALAAQNTALIMGPSGVPIPKPTYIQSVFNLYIGPNYPGAIPFQLDTPEGLYPITGVKSLPLNVSVEQGLEILTAAIAEQIGRASCRERV